MSKLNYILSLFVMLAFANTLIAQIKDTVYFDLEGEIIIEEVASYYRVASYDTSSGHILGNFFDSSIDGDTIAIGKISYMNEQKHFVEYLGDSSFQDIAIKMSDLKPSFIRINDYPHLKHLIKPAVTNKQERQKEAMMGGEFYIVGKYPTFPGGRETLTWFISRFITYPEEAQKNEVTGVVKVRFLVDLDGSIKNISVLEGIGYGCDEEAIRVMSLLPDWLPALQKGYPVKAYMELPLTFQ
ncbi:MAG: energy transducer TonB [Bacteroidetes bacterium]|nr:energy transducer TonB [Bacteroidota bacterium]